MTPLEAERKRPNSKLQASPVTLPRKGRTSAAAVSPPSKSSAKGVLAQRVEWPGPLSSSTVWRQRIASCWNPGTMALVLDDPPGEQVGSA